MTKYRPATPATDAIVRPPYSRCATHTHLIGIEPEKPGYDLRTFECPKCGQFETSVVEIAAL
jgi:hypothetical protein